VPGYEAESACSFPAHHPNVLKSIHACRPSPLSMMARARCPSWCWRGTSPRPHAAMCWDRLTSQACPHCPRVGEGWIWKRGNQNVVSDITDIMSLQMNQHAAACTALVGLSWQAKGCCAVEDVLLYFAGQMPYYQAYYTFPTCLHDLCSMSLQGT
jgi:hypothetical protein